MEEFKLHIILEPHIKEANGRRHLFMIVNAFGADDAKERASQMISCLLKDGVELIVEISR